MPDLDIREIHLLRGPNIWANYPVMEAWVDLGSLKDTGSDEVPGFNERLKSWLPGMIEHRCSVGERGGFFQRLDRGTYPAHILEHVTLELQTMAGHPLGFGKARETCVEGLYKVIVRYLDEVVVQECLRTARELLLAAYTGGEFDVASEVTRLQDVVDNNALGPSTKAIVDAAKERGIPWRRLQEGRSLIQLGQGVKQRRIWTAETDRTGAIAEYIAQDKDLTRTILKQSGVPVPQGRVVTDADDAWEAAGDVGLPVVVKPTDGNHGRGVFIDLSTREQVTESYKQALNEGSGVMVERFIPGVDHRLLVVGSKMIAANRGEPACVVGNGKMNVRDLIESQLNSDPRRGTRDETPWSIINTVDDIDPTMIVDLQKQGHDLTTIPREGERVLVWRFANPSVDVTDEVHPSIREHVVVAAKTAGLDICGIDVVCRDIGRPLEEQGGALVEINASPGLNIHLKPAVGQGRPVGEAIVDMLFPEGEDGRIPVIGITGTHGKTTATKLVAHLLKSTGKFLGVSHSDGLQFGERHAESKQGDRLFGTQGVLLHPWTEIAICETSAESIILEGVGYDRCQIGVVLNVGTEHLGLGYIDTLEQMTKVKRCVVDVVLPGGTAVLNADDPLVAGMAEYSKGSVVFFSRDPGNATLAAHRSSGGRAVWVKDEVIHLAEGETERRLCALDDVSLPVTGHFAFHLESVLAAVATAWVCGVADAAIVEGLRSDD
ncbi:cyanophycin synthetase [Prosthecobacter sp.]|uniref:cyanophycin synthetase n=1 Tax=Prosthecobacter sp. TaxID=1965333 RepID=UPI001E18CAD1|nr:cyanophycin synthetase [Prosthecobacter sp.]MCB1277920.1 cyanophycin synthetase [Prosthecobacter sp.]